MIEHVYARTGQARTVDAVVVATDDDRIAAAVDAFGGTAVMTRDTHPSGTDRLAEVAAELTCDVVVNVQGDEPLITGEAIDAAVAPLLHQPAELMTTLRRELLDPDDHSNPNVVKIAIDREGYALYFTRAPIPYVRPGSPTPASWKHLGLYVYRRDFLLRIASLATTPLERAEGLEQLRVLEHGFRIRTVETTEDSLGVDTPEDLERVRLLVTAGIRP
jgi:3-deoxy-manno-octulosonate cytidylyltransferase (CMP-KDO synthetase)